MFKQTLQWKFFIPLIVVMGLGLSLWSGAYLIKTEKNRWHNTLHASADKHASAIVASWNNFSIRAKGFDNLFTTSKNVTEQNFNYLAKSLLAQKPFAKGVIYIPAKNNSNSSYIFPKTALLENSQKNLIQKSISPKAQQLLKPASRSLLPIGSLILGKKLGHSGEHGALFSIIEIPSLITTSGIAPDANLILQIKNGGAPLLSKQIIAGDIDNSLKITKEIRLGGADWILSWEFNKQSAGGMKWLPGVIIIILGLLMTTIFTWIVWAQQGIASKVHKQVIERTEELEQASRRFKLITDNAYDLIAISGIDGVLEYVNSSYNRVLGYSKKELRGSNFAKFVHKKDLLLVQNALNEVTKGKTAVELSFRIKRKTGEWLFMEAVAKGLHDTDWSMKSIVIHCRDVTSRKQFAEDLAQSEQRFRDFADSSADWLWEVDEALRFTYISSGVAHVLGYEPEEMIGNMQFDALFEKKNDPTRELIESRISRCQPYRDIEFWTRSKDENRICLRISGVPVLNDAHEFTGYRGVATNITASKIDRDHMYRLATTDHLTGLLNRRRFMEELERSLNLAKRHSTSGVLMFIDLDRFKEINDTHGHEAGDMILKGITKILEESFRSTDIIARIGGDEFAIIMHNIDVDGASQKVAEVIDQINAFEVHYGGARLSVTMSIGMVVYPQDEKDCDALMMSADLAMYRAKDMGRNRMYVDKEGESGNNVDSVREQLKWLTRLRTCLETGDFEMHYQPIIPSKKKARPLFEALLRIYDEEGNVGSPALYIDAAEHFGLIQKLDLSVTEKCFQTQMKLKNSGVDVDFSINLSSRSLGDKEVMQALRDMTKKYDIDPNRIMFEATETMALHDPSSLRDISEIRNFIKELRTMGFRFALDDFGAGFSSFQYIRQLPVDVVKIDGNYVKNVENSKEDRLFLEAMAHLCQGMGIETIAEFVENEKIVKILEDLGIDYSQGWHLGKPEADIVANTIKYQGARMKNFLTTKPNLKPAPKKTKPKPVKIKKSA